MRLIDADKLKREHPVATFIVDDAPTVEAIPIDWLQEWGYKHFANYYHNISFETVIDGAINDYRKWWRKERNDETD